MLRPGSCSITSSTRAISSGSPAAIGLSIIARKAAGGVFSQSSPASGAMASRTGCSAGLTDMLGSLRGLCISVFLANGLSGRAAGQIPRSGYGEMFHPASRTELRSSSRITLNMPYHLRGSTAVSRSRSDSAWTSPRSFSTSSASMSPASATMDAFGPPCRGRPT